jgi:nucleotide-binding universal stress UspA family protein
MQSAARSFPHGIETIVVATDFSQYADKALLRTVDLARRFNSKVVLTHVIDPLAYSVALNGEPFILRRIKIYVQDRLNYHAEVLRREEIPFELVLREGMVRESLCDLVRDRDADLLVVGSHGEQRFDRDACGSTAEKILRVAPCPVLIMGPLTCPLGPRSSSPSRILFATGFADTSLRTLPFADALAYELGAELHLLHVASPVSTTPDAARKCMDRLNDVAMKHIHRTPIVRCVVQMGSLAETIASVAGSIDAIATVLGVQQEDLQRKPVGGLRQGLIYTIVNRTCCPVITLQSGLDVSGLRTIAIPQTLLA